MEQIVTDNPTQAIISTPARKCVTRDPSSRSISSVRTPSIFNKQSNILTYTDPESYTWDPLDGELAKKLDERPYVSLSRDRCRPAEGTSESTGTEADAEINDDEVSLFDLHMPGVLSLKEVKALDLDHWLLLVHGSFVHMNVSTFLSEWISSVGLILTCTATGPRGMGDDAYG